MTTWADRLGVFDLETTGVDVEMARIVTACIAVLDADGAVVQRWDWLADPGVEIPEAASAVHGITTERARAEAEERRKKAKRKARKAEKAQRVFEQAESALERARHSARSRPAADAGK